MPGLTERLGIGQEAASMCGAILEMVARPLVEALMQSGADERGGWRVDDLLLVPAGEWLVRLEVLVSDFERLAFDTSFLR